VDSMVIAVPTRLLAVAILVFMVFSVESLMMLTNVTMLLNVSSISVPSRPVLLIQLLTTQNVEMEVQNFAQHLTTALSHIVILLMEIALTSISLTNVMTTCNVLQILAIHLPDVSMHKSIAAMWLMSVTLLSVTTLP